MNRGELCGVVLLDLRKAFDLINHKCLLQKLSIYKCDEKAMKWFESNLTGRTQTTNFRGHSSDSRPVTVGVPQGSILGPLFFILYMNDLPLCVTNDIDMYGDDSSLSSIGSDISQLTQSLDSDMEAVAEWCDQNHMALNTAKTR